MPSESLGSTPEKCYKILDFQGVERMQQTLKTIHVKVADLLVEETKIVDNDGRLLGYVAVIYVRERGSVRPRFVRKTRLPETAAVLAAAIQRHGLRALETFSTAA
jgi:hypothetical protein